MNAIHSISVIVPCFNSEPTLGDCLASVFASTHDDFEVIVVDDGSDDASLDVARKYDCRILAMPKNCGAAAARNAGARAAVGEILFFLDADITVPPNVLEQIDATFVERPEIGAAFCSYEKKTAPRNFCSVYKNLLHHYTHQTAREDAITFCSGFGAIRRDVFMSSGGFDENYRFLEDIEFGYRLHRAGQTILLRKQIQLTHLKRYSLASLIGSDLFGRAIPWTRIMLEKRIFRNDLNTKMNNVASVALAVVIPVVLASALLSPRMFLVVLTMCGLFAMLNIGFYRFVLRERGWFFLMQSVAMNWLGYVYSGIGLAWGVASFLIDSPRRNVNHQLVSVATDVDPSPVDVRAPLTTPAEL